MNELTLVLPFALPPPLLAPDLLRALQSPDPGSPVALQPLSALAALVTRATSRQSNAFDNGSRVLPHEAWLAHALGLAPHPAGPDAGAPLAAAALRGFGVEPGDGAWFIVQPVHLQLARTHLVINDTRPDLVDELDGRALFEAAQPYFEEEGKTLVYGDANTWFVRADDWKDLSTASPDAAAGQNLADWMPEGDKARDSRRLQNEVQMLWHAHATNEAREARGAKPMNSFWLWGGAAAGAVNGATPPLFCAEGPAWMTALAAPGRRAPEAAALLNGAERAAIVVLGTLIEAGLAEDWATWLAQMQRLETAWFAPLLAGLKNGSLGKLTLVLSHRSGYLELTSTKNAQRAFWRKPSLKGLLP